MNPQRRARLNKKLAGLERECFVPKVETKDIVSKLGGAAWLETGKTWPTCKSCKRPMHLLVQLRAADVPASGPAIPTVTR